MTKKLHFYVLSIFLAQFCSRIFHFATGCFPAIRTMRIWKSLDRKGDIHYSRSITNDATRKITKVSKN
jgi:hypothetical protein